MVMTLLTCGRKNCLTMVLRNYKFIHLTKFIFIVLMLTLIILLKMDFTLDAYYTYWVKVETTTCYYDRTEDLLPSAESRRFSPPPQSIFFHETSCRGGLNPRQACAVEAAARAHPDWEVYVLFAAPVKFIEESISTLRAFKNIHFARIHVEEYVKGTPAEDLVVSGALNRTQWKISHTSDVLRYLTLYKWGGVYLDLDTVVVKSFNSLKNNWSARESNAAVSAGAMSFSTDQLGRAVADVAIRNLVDNFRGDKWGHNGPGVITRILKKVCFSEDVSTMSAKTCRGFEVYPPQLFYPISWRKAHEYFEPGVLDSDDVYVYHVWNKVTSNIRVLENSRYANLAKKYCPNVYEDFSEHFGLNSSYDKYFRGITTGFLYPRK